jgi:hypothetical protein
VNSPRAFTFSIASGQTIFPGFNVYMPDAGIPASSPVESFVAPAFPVSDVMPLSARLGQSFLRYAVISDSSANYLTFDVRSGGAYAQRLTGLSKLELITTDLTSLLPKEAR